MGSKWDIEKFTGDNDFGLWKTDFTLMEKKTYRIFGPDLLQFYEGYFYYKYRLCIRANLEIEGAETRV